MIVARITANGLDDLENDGGIRTISTRSPSSSMPTTSNRSSPHDSTKWTFSRRRKVRFSKPSGISLLKA